MIKSDFKKSKTFDLIIIRQQDRIWAQQIIKQNEIIYCILEDPPEGICIIQYIKVSLGSLLKKIVNQSREIKNQRDSLHRLRDAWLYTGVAGSGKTWKALQDHGKNAIFIAMTRGIVDQIRRARICKNCYTIE